MIEERLRILEMVSDGSVTVDQAASLIAALEASEDSGDDGLEDAHTNPPALSRTAPGADDGTNEDLRQNDPPVADGEEGARPDTISGIRKWRNYRYIPLAVGILTTTLGGLLVFAGMTAGWHWFWMACVWPLLGLGILMLITATLGGGVRWVHVRVNTGQDEWPRRIAISLPLPLRTTAWFLRVFGGRIPGLDSVPVPMDEAVLALQHSVSPDDPLYVQVEESGGERVEVYIG